MKTNSRSAYSYHLLLILGIFALAPYAKSADLDQSVINQKFLTIDWQEPPILTNCSEEIAGPVLIPDGVTTIDWFAFAMCKRLTSVTIPGSVTTIEAAAFYLCERLTSVSIPDSVTTIGDEAFFSCTGLTSVSIPDSVTTIGDEAFERCTRLTSITIPQTFHSKEEAARLRLASLWPNGFVLPSSSIEGLKLFIQFPLKLRLVGKKNFEAVIETANEVSGPWTEFKSVVIEPDGKAEIDLSNQSEKRFFRISQ